MSDSGLSALLLSYLWAGWSGLARLAPKLSTPSTGSPRSGLTRQTLSWPSIFRSGFRPLGSGRFRADHGTGRSRRLSIRGPGWCSWRSDAGSDWAGFAGDGPRSGRCCPTRRHAPPRCTGCCRFAHERNEGRAFSFCGGHGEAGVVLLDIDVRQPAIGRLDRRDPVHSQQRRQALLQRVPEPLYPPPRLRAVGGDVRDVQLLQRPPHLRQKRLVDLRARLRREEVVAAPVGVERREQTMSADRSLTARESSRPCPPPHIEKSK